MTNNWLLLILILGVGGEKKEWKVRDDNRKTIDCLICLVKLVRAVSREIIENIPGCKIPLEYVQLHRRIFYNKAVFVAQLLASGII